MRDTQYWITRMQWYVRNRTKITSKIQTTIDQQYKFNQERFAKYTETLAVTTPKDYFVHDNKQLTIKNNLMYGWAYFYDGIESSSLSFANNDFRIYSRAYDYDDSTNKSYYVSTPWSKLSFFSDVMYFNGAGISLNYYMDEDTLNLSYQSDHKEDGPAKVTLVNGKVTSQQFMFNGVNITKWLEKKKYTLPMSDIQKWECILSHDFSKPR